MNYIQTNAPEGIFNFDDTGSSGCPYTFDQCGGDSMASFMMGQVSLNNGSYYEIQDRPATEDHQFAVYGQENWKATPKLTVNLGLRWDVVRSTDGSLQPSELVRPHGDLHHRRYRCPGR